MFAAADCRPGTQFAPRAGKRGKSLLASAGSEARLPHRLSAQDAAFVYGESSRGPLHVGCITYFDGRIDVDEFVSHMAARMQLLPRYRQRLAFVPFNLAHATW